MQQKPKKAIQIYLEEEQIHWLDKHKGPELKRGGVIRNLIREKMKETFDQDEYDEMMERIKEKTEILRRENEERRRENEEKKKKR